MPSIDYGVTSYWDGSAKVYDYSYSNSSEDSPFAVFSKENLESVDKGFDVKKEDEQLKVVLTTDPVKKQKRALSF